jgi:hypothetical protein
MDGLIPCACWLLLACLLPNPNPEPNTKFTRPLTFLLCFLVVFVDGPLQFTLNPCSVLSNVALPFLVVFVFSKSNSNSLTLTLTLTLTLSNPTQGTKITYLRWWQELRKQTSGSS